MDVTDNTFACPSLEQEARRHDQQERKMVVHSSLSEFWFDGKHVPTCRPFPTRSEDQPDIIPCPEGSIAECYVCPYSLEPPHDPVHVQIRPGAVGKYSPQVFEHATVVRAMMTPGPWRQTRLWKHPANGAWVERTEAMQLIVQASPEIIALCRAERSHLASIGSECEATFPLWKGDEIKYQDFMKKCKTNHVFGTETDDDWRMDFGPVVDGAINPSGGPPIPLIDLAGTQADTMRIAAAIRGNLYNEGAKETALEFIRKRRRMQFDVDSESEKE